MTQLTDAEVAKRAFLRVVLSGRRDHPWIGCAELGNVLLTFISPSTTPYMRDFGARLPQLLRERETSE